MSLSTVLAVRVNRDEPAVDAVGLEMGMVLSAVTFWTMMKEEI